MSMFGRLTMVCYPELYSITDDVVAHTDGRGKVEDSGFLVEGFGSWTEKSGGRGGLNKRGRE